jgi:hypothetical protein
MQWRNMRLGDDAAVGGILGSDIRIQPSLGQWIEVAGPSSWHNPNSGLEVYHCSLEALA